MQWKRAAGRETHTRLATIAYFLHEKGTLCSRGFHFSEIIHTPTHIHEYVLNTRPSLLSLHLIFSLHLWRRPLVLPMFFFVVGCVCARARACVPSYYLAFYPGDQSMSCVLPFFLWLTWQIWRGRERPRHLRMCWGNQAAWRGTHLHTQTKF